MEMYDMAYEHHIFLTSVWLILWAVIITGLFLIIRAFMERRIGKEKRAIDILSERYVRGEITREEYLEKKRDISG